jgi:SAM-dependent methyltransferase
MKVLMLIDSLRLGGAERVLAGQSVRSHIIERGISQVTKAWHRATSAEADTVHGNPDLPSTVPWDLVVCPICRGPLDRNGVDLRCPRCAQEYGATDAGQPDLRLRQAKETNLTVRVGEPVLPIPPVSVKANPSPEIDFSGLVLPANVSRRFASYLPIAGRPGARALDLGCGTARARTLLEHAGYEYVGLDFAEPEAQLLADAHALPFADSAFDLILTIGVIEYLRHPYLAMCEAHRVLRDGGCFAGNVAFLLPFLPDTYFHHTHVGIVSTLTYAGFDIDRLLLDKRWTVLEATGAISLFPRLPRPLLRALIKPLKALHIAWWRLGRHVVQRPLTEVERLLRITADIEFIAHKPLVPPSGAASI